jgi:hypothetical protein
LINIGGNIMALGSKGGQAWKVGIQHPRRAGALAMLELHDGEAIGTSGDYQRYFELDGKRYCHLIDPRTGWPATGAGGDGDRQRRACRHAVRCRQQAAVHRRAGDWRRLAGRWASPCHVHRHCDGRFRPRRAWRGDWSGIPNQNDQTHHPAPDWL